MASDVKTASDFMRRKLVTLRPDAKVVDAVARMLKDNISGAPVIDSQGNYLGVFSEKSCMNALTEVAVHAGQVGLHVPCVREFMTTSLITLSPDLDVFDAIDQILARHISGAPVLDNAGRFLGIFSEKTAMQVLISAAYDQLPGTKLDAYMNTDPRRVIDDQATLIEIAQKFQQTPYRRLPVLIHDKLAGQVSRRDVIKCEHAIAQNVAVESVRAGSDIRLRMSNGNCPVEQFMDRNAKTIPSDEDLLNVAQIFLNTPYRRLPVVEGGKLLGLVSRRDLLMAAASLLRLKPPSHKAEPLYLSPLSDTAPQSLR